MFILRSISKCFLSSSPYIQQFVITLHTKFFTNVLTTRKKNVLLHISSGVQWKILTHAAGHSEQKWIYFNQCSTFFY